MIREGKSMTIRTILRTAAHGLATLPMRILEAKLRHGLRGHHLL